MKKRPSSLGLGIIALSSLLIYFLFYLPRLYTTDLNKGGWLFDFIYKYLGQPGLWLFFIIASLNLLLLTRSKTRKPDWKSSGIYSAFIISLFTEMFGSTLVVYLFAPFFRYPLLTPQYNIYLFPPIVKTVSFYFIFVGILLIIIGWVEIYKTEDLSTKGIYRFIRHPQYLGFILVASGWIFAWPTVISLILYPFLVVLYIHQALSEDKILKQKYGQTFLRYKKKTGLFFPKINWRQEKIQPPRDLTSTR
jgi:protein-S-isoprenylcysteine O-methyltransferase Ste14